MQPFDNGRKKEKERVWTRIPKSYPGAIYMNYKYIKKYIKPQ